jgi:hypothetical protein
VLESVFATVHPPCALVGFFGPVHRANPPGWED